MAAFSFVPDEKQSLLLDALLLPPAAARPAVLAWLGAIDFDHLDLGSLRLMPLLDRRLSELGIDHPLAGKIRGQYRRAWYLDQQMRRSLEAVLADCDRLQIPVILLKGAALGLQVYGNGALRPCDDIDLLVPHGDFERAAAALVSAGWSGVSGPFHATSFRAADGTQIDLHVSPFLEAFRQSHVAGLWGRADTVSTEAGRRVRVLAPADQLLHTLAHGMRWNDLSPIRWIVDAVMLVRKPGVKMDWAVLTDEVERLELGEVAFRGLTLLSRHLPDEIPAEALRRIQASRSRRSRIEFLLDRQLHLPIGPWIWTRRNARGFERLRLIEKHYRDAGRLESRAAFLVRSARRFTARLLRLPRRALPRRP
jgi:hypothetical protein